MKTPKPVRAEGKHYTSYAGWITWLLAERHLAVLLRDFELPVQGVHGVCDTFQHRKSASFHILDWKTTRRVAKGRNCGLRDLFLHNISQFTANHFVFAMNPAATDAGRLGSPDSILDHLLQFPPCSPKKQARIRVFFERRSESPKRKPTVISRSVIL